MTKADTKRDIQQAAADWLLRVQEPDVTEADLLEWDAWLKADRRHRRAFDALESASAFIAREQTALSDIPLPSDAALSADNYTGEVPIAELIDHSPNNANPAVTSSQHPAVAGPRRSTVAVPVTPSVSRSGLKNTRGSGFQPRLNANLAKIAPRWRSHDCLLEPNQIFETTSSESPLPSSAQSSVRSHGIRWAIAATVLLTIGATTWFAINEDWLTAPETQLQVVETQESEHRSIELEDGSTIALGAASSLSVNYSGERRTVVLEAGEALFEVAKDPNRPFVVLAGNGTITAVGTAFNVRRDADRVVVTVTEGEVEVVQQGGSIARVPDDSLTEIAIPARQTLAVGERVEYSAAGIARLDNIEPAVATEWRNGRLRYRAESLKHVIPDVDRYSPQTVIIGDAAVGELKFTGTVFQDNADEWLRGLEAVFPVEVVELDDQQLLLRLRDQDQ